MTVDAHIGGEDAQNRVPGVCSPVVTDLHHLNEEQDSEPDPHESEAGSGSASALM
jgi:hypothetical protein